MLFCLFALAFSTRPTTSSGRANRLWWLNHPQLIHTHSSHRPTVPLTISNGLYYYYLYIIRVADIASNREYCSLFLGGADMYRWIFARLLKVICIAGFFVLYYTSIVPWWVNRAGTCSIARRPYDMVEYIWAVWTSSDCTWASSQAQWTLPAIFVLSPFLIWLMIELWAGWNGGPPDWSVAMTGFGIGALGAVFVAFVSFQFLVWIIQQLAVNLSSMTILEELALVAYVLGMIVVSIWVWVMVYRANAALFKHLRTSASAPIVYMGSTVGAAVGVSIGLGVILLALFVLAIYAFYIVLMGMATVAVVGLVAKR